MYDTVILNKISSFGVLGYSVDKIVFLIDPADPEQLAFDLSTPGTEAYKAYQKGKTTGEYTLDKGLFDKATKDKDIVANQLMVDRLQTDKINDKIKESFGL